MIPEEQPIIVPRNNPDFGLDGDIPRFWFGGDPFKTRLFDALSTIFPEGERFFINCVRDYRERITDPALLEQVKDFTRQEGQHGMVHEFFNRRLRAQGIRTDRIDAFLKTMLGGSRRFLPRRLTLAFTAAAEHMTAVTSHCFSQSATHFLDADPRVNAMYIWHGMEEIEHKAVAFDVLQKVAGAGYFSRAFAMLYMTLVFPLTTFGIMRHMFRVDGFDWRQRAGLWFRGLRWMYGRDGLYRGVSGHYLAWYRPGFHPWKHGDMHTYHTWLEAYRRSGDPLAAGNALAASVRAEADAGIAVAA